MKVLTGKGKEYVSYLWVDGERIPSWYVQFGGKEQIIKVIERFIKEGRDRKYICTYFNISPSTCKRFLKNNLSLELNREIERVTKEQSAKTRSKSLKGKSKKSKGKSYLEIYGTEKPGCGFKTGSKNPNYFRSKFIGRKCLNSRGESFRSKYEVEFSELLIKNNISYLYEERVVLHNQKLKIVDFVIGDFLVEITGYAYDAWKKDFDAKIQLLHATVPDKKILIISRNFGNKEIIKELSEKHSSPLIKVISLDEPDKILCALKV